MIAPTVKSDPVVIGIVKDLKDPNKLGRVRVTLPHLKHQPTYWARLATLMAGNDRGSLFRPELEDEVLVAFVHGDARQAYVIGALWNEKDPPPENGGKEENHLRTLRSRSGHVIRFDDTPGGEKIEVIGKGEKHQIVIDVGGDMIRIKADTGDIEVEAGGGSVTVKAAKDMTLEAGVSMSLSAPDVTIKGDAAVTVQGGVIKLN